MPPDATAQTVLTGLEYVGFRPRDGSSYWTDPGLIRGPADFLITWILPAVGVLRFWFNHQATPGKMAISARVVDARTSGT